MGRLKTSSLLGYDENLPCGCGEPIRSCGFWKGITAKAYGSRYDNPEAVRRHIALRSRISRIRRILFSGRPEFRMELDTFIAEHVTPLYRSLRLASGARLVVDASNLSWWMLLLARCEEVDLHVLHLVRDPRAVVYSFKRKKLRPEYKDKVVYSPTHSSVTSAKHWSINNFIPLVLSRFIPESRYIRVRYEAFASEPKQGLRQVAAFAGLGDEVLSVFTGERTASPRPSHAILGNPMRFEKNLVIKPDEAWRTELGALDKAIVSALTWPLSRAL